MTYKERVLSMDIWRLDVVQNGKAKVLAKEKQEGGAYKYQLKFINGLIFWVWRSSVNYYFVQPIFAERPTGFEGGPALNFHLNNLSTTSLRGVR